MMRGLSEKPFVVLLVLASVLPGAAFAQLAPPALTKIEPGLEPAIRWKWQVEPSRPQDWGLPLPVFAAPIAAPSVPGSAPNVAGHVDAQGRPDTYVVKKGDALILIGKRFKVSVDRLKEANGLKNNLIHIGDVLRIPPPDALPVAKPPAAGHPSDGATTAAAEFETLTLQVFLDRVGFSAGPIDGAISPQFQRLVALFQGAHPDLGDTSALLAKAHAAGDPLTHYTLRPEDWRFIAPPKAVPVSAKATPTPSKKHKSKSPGIEPAPKPTFADLTTSRLLAYRSPWEFVAERFHCDENYLRKLNPQITGLPTAGAVFRVPNVIPFAVEAPLIPPLQPAPNPQARITAAVVGRTRLEISRDDRLLATMPVSIARPGLRGEGSWTVLDAIPHPRLRIEQDFSRAAPTPTRIYGTATPSPVAPTPTPVPRVETLAPGPDNPVGVLWINLAKSATEPPLPYGLHGTSIPDEMTTHESFGGLRMANWDIVRIVRLLPPGTPLEWKADGPVLPPPAPRP